MEEKAYNPVIVDDELLELAYYFSDNYRSLKVDTYFSKDKTYCIEYLDRIIIGMSGEWDKTGVRVAMQAGVIEMDKTILSDEEYTSDFIFYLIIWCISRRQNDSIIQADNAAIKYYQSTRRSIKNLLKGFAKLVSNSNTALNMRRTENILYRTNK